MNSRTIYKENYWEFILWSYSQVLATMVIIMLLSTIFVMQQGSKRIEELEKTLGVNETFEYYEIKSVDVSLKEYVDTLQLPQILQDNQATETVETVKAEETVETVETVETAKTVKTESSQVVEKTATQQVANYTETEVELLARLMYAEEGIFLSKLSEDEAKYISQLAGSVVIHRRDVNFGGAQTIEEVIYAKGQYDCVEKGTIYQDIPDIMYEWAEELLRDGPIGPENLVYQAEFVQGNEVYEHIENQYFCLN